MSDSDLVKVEVQPLSGEKYDLKGCKAYGVRMKLGLDRITTVWIEEVYGVTNEVLAEKVRQELVDELGQFFLRTISTVLLEYSSPVKGGKK